MSGVLDYCNRCGTTHDAACWRGELAEIRDWAGRRLSALEAARDAWRVKGPSFDELYPPHNFDAEPTPTPPPAPEEKWGELARREYIVTGDLRYEAGQRLAAEFARIDSEAEARGYTRDREDARSSLDKLIAQARSDERELAANTIEERLRKDGHRSYATAVVAALRRGKS